MTVDSQNILRGPNYWSHSHSKLIQTRLLVAANFTVAAPQQEICTSFIKSHVPGFELPAPSNTINHHLAQTAGLALALQNAVGCDVLFWQHANTAFKNTHILLVAYEIETVGLWAVNKAIECVGELQNGVTPDFDGAIADLKRIVATEQPSPKIAALRDWAQKAGLPLLPGLKRNALQIGLGAKSMQFNEALAPATVKNLVENGVLGRIPIIAVSGSNGKTTTTRLLAHIINTGGQAVGFTTSDGVYINHEMVDEGDTTGPMSAQLVLSSQQVEVAVLETARGGIVRAGLGFDACDVAVVTNVQDDHLGISDIETMEQLAQVKAVIVKAVKPGGWAILNAQNTYTVAMANVAPCPVAWFSASAANPLVQNAIATGIPTCFIENGWVVLQKGAAKEPVSHLQDVPITFNGTLSFMVENVLAATLAAAAFNIPTAVISAALKTFYPSLSQTPGRMNIFDIQKSKLLVDFAHNPDGFAGIRDFLNTIEAPLKIGIIVGTGDRKDSDMRELGRISAQMFDVTLVHQVKFLRGKTAEALVALLVEGMHAHNPNAQWQRIPDCEEPLAYALKLAQPQSFIVALSDVLSDVPMLLKNYS